MHTISTPPLGRIIVRTRCVVGGCIPRICIRDMFTVVIMVLVAFDVEHFGFLDPNTLYVFKEWHIGRKR
jgi:hypothetical protein